MTIANDYWSIVCGDNASLFTINTYLTFEILRILSKPTIEVKESSQMALW